MLRATSVQGLAEFFQRAVHHGLDFKHGLDRRFRQRPTAVDNKLQATKALVMCGWSALDKVFQQVGSELLKGSRIG